MTLKSKLVLALVALSALAVGCDEDPVCPNNGVYGKYGCGPAPADAAAIVDAAADAANRMVDAAVDTAED